MFFFWGPFFFILPALAIYYVLRHIMGTDRSENRRRKWIDEFEAFEYPPAEGHPQTAKAQGARIYKLAYKLKGRITVSDIVIETGLDVDTAEELIQSMVDNQRIRMEVRDDGIVLYEFPEIIARFESRDDFDFDRN